MATKDFTYRGKGTEELQQMDTREFAKLLKSRARRAVLRQFNEIEDFLVRCRKKKENGKPIRTHLRGLIIVPRLIGNKIFIHNGKQFLPIEIIPEMLGHRLGEFAVTRQKVNHGAAGIGATKSSMAKATKKK